MPGFTSVYLLGCSRDGRAVAETRPARVGARNSIQTDENQPIQWSSGIKTRCKKRGEKLQTTEMDLSEMLDRTSEENRTNVTQR